MTTEATPVYQYDPRCQYRSGHRILIDIQAYGQTLATVTGVIKQSLNHQCDKISILPDDPDFKEKWEAHRTTPFFACDLGRKRLEPIVVMNETPRPSALSRSLESVPDDAPPALPQTTYTSIVLACIDRYGTTPLLVIQDAVEASDMLGPRDWLRRGADDKIVWRERLNGAISNLKRTGVIKAVGRERYRRVEAHGGI